MAEDKRKILENARKYAQKGAQEKALKEYQKLVKLDPKDAKLRLEIGDAYRRWGKNDEALSTYQKVADQYMREGFDARAVAVYKQILTLAPDHHAAYEPLAELYERMGLTAEAISALQTAADGYHKQGKKREALELLRKMATIDPTNTTSRIKVAELLRQEKLIEEAVAEYTQVAAELERQSDFDAASNVYRRLLELEPNNDAALGAFGRNLLRQNKPPEAESVARRAIAANGEEPAHYELLADALRAQNREDKLAEAYKPLVELYSRRGDDARAREIAQRYLPQSELSADSAFGDNFDADSLDGGDLEPHPENARGLEAGDDRFDVGDLSDQLGDDIELDDELSSPEIELTNVAGDDGDGGDEPIIERPQGDPDQLFAEASVYLRYGKSDKAIAHLQAILEQAPNHRGALEKLGEAYAERGDEGEAVKLWLRAAKRAQAEGASAAAAVLQDRIEALDPKAAASLGPAPKKAAPPPPPKREATPLQVKVKTVPPPKPAPPVQRDPEPEIDADLGEEEVDLDVDLSEVESEHAAAEQAPVTAVDSVDLASAATDTGIDGASLSTATTQQILEDLEEADFYLEQGLMDEAEGLFKRVLAIAPNHPRALVRLGELAAARGGDPAAAGAAKSAAAKPAAARPAPAKSAARPAPAPAARAPARERALEEPEPLPDISIDEEVSPPAAAANEVPDDEIAAAFDVDGTAEPAPSHDPNEETPAFAGSLPQHEIARPAPPPPTPAKVRRPAPAPAAARPGPPPPAVQAAAPREELTAPEESGDFDLAAELSDAFDDANGKSGTPANVDFETVFAAFKKGVSQTLDAEDYEAHYDLGIAYKEMGLWPDAINEFRIAMGNRARETECLHLIGLCGLESGDYPLAIEHLERLLGRVGLAKEQALAARFDLGRTLAAADRRDEARIAFQAVAAQDPDFQDVAAQLKALDEPKKVGDASESFDDLLSEMSDDDAESEEKQDAKGESFEDLFADEGAAEADAPEAAEPEPEPAPAKRPAPRAPAPPPSVGPGKKKKKISFL